MYNLNIKLFDKLYSIQVSLDSSVSSVIYVGIIVVSLVIMPVIFIISVVFIFSVILINWVSIIWIFFSSLSFSFNITVNSKIIKIIKIISIIKLKIKIFILFFWKKFSFSDWLLWLLLSLIFSSFFFSFSFFSSTLIWSFPFF